MAKPRKPRSGTAANRASTKDVIDAEVVKETPPSSEKTDTPASDDKPKATEKPTGISDHAARPGAEKPAKADDAPSSAKPDAEKPDDKPVVTGGTPKTAADKPAASSVPPVAPKASTTSGSKAPAEKAAAVSGTEAKTVGKDAPAKSPGSATGSPAGKPGNPPESARQGGTPDKPAEKTSSDGAKPPASSKDTGASSAKPSDAPKAAPAEKTPPKPAAPASAPPKQQSRGGFVPLVLGGIVAAAIGFGASLFLFPDGFQGSGDDEAFRASTRTAIGENTATVADLQARLQRLDDATRAVEIPDISGLEGQVAAFSARLESVGDSLAQLEARLSDLEKRPVTAAVSDEAIAAYEREVAALRETVATQRAEAEEMQTNARRTAQEALAQSALTRIASAIDSGAPFRAALTDLSSAVGADIPAALESVANDGVPTQTALEDAFPEVSRNALAAARRADSQADGGSRLGTFLKNQLGARSVAPREGSDPDAVLSRAEAALRERRLGDAVTELELLSDTARAELESWISKATTRLDALAALDSLGAGLKTQ